MNRKKNIIVYLSDQQRADTLGCYGQKLDVSPVLDELAKGGTLFEYAYTCQPVCGPARACIQTGKYPNRTGCYMNEYGLKENENTIAKELGRAGYETAYVGKWHLACDLANGVEYLHQAIPPERMGGFQDYVMAAEALEVTSHGYDGHVYDRNGNKVEFIGYRTDCITDYAIHYLRNKESTAPFFLFISHIEPHQQNDRDCYEGPDGSKERFQDYEVPPDLLCGKYEGDWKRNYPDYLGQCRKLDDNLGKIVETLKEKGMYDDTVIIYTSDHGCHFRTQDGEYKRNGFESCLRIPLVISGGDFQGGGRISELVSNIQLPATILKAAGVDIPEDMIYEPLQDALGEECSYGDVIFYQVSETELARGIRTRKWKYQVHAPHKQPLLHMDAPFSVDSYNQMRLLSREDSDSYIEQYLFDLETDPYEMNNIVDDPQYAPFRLELGELLRACMARAGEKPPVIYPSGTALAREYNDDI